MTAKKGTGNGLLQMLLGQELRPDEKTVTAPVTVERKDLNILPKGKSDGWANRLGSTMFVSNLCFTVDWRRLKQGFQMARTVRYADI